ncbi:MAG: glycosyltransferase [Flavobacteriales bacterium]|nr:glycosyltransferase [Flavobacteriales bacterium]
MNQPEVTVIMPAYNAERWLAEAVNSIIAQTHRDWELLIVNDGSTDGTLEVAYSFGDPRITVIDQTNAGVSAARNAGLAAARGTHICFMDADDRMLPSNLDVKLSGIREHQVDWVFGDLEICDEHLNSTGEVMIGTDKDVLRTLLLAIEPAVPGAGSNIFAHRRCFDAGIRFDEHLSNSADQDMTVSLASTATYKHIPGALCQYRYVPGSMSKNIALFERDHSRLFAKARERGLLDNWFFRQRCLSNLDWAIGGSWWKLAHRYTRALPFLTRAVFRCPLVLVRPIKKRIWPWPHLSPAR